MAEAHFFLGYWTWKRHKAAVFDHLILVIVWGTHSQCMDLSSAAYLRGFSARHGGEAPAGTCLDFFSLATAQRWVPLSHEKKTPAVNRNVLGNLKETKVLQKTLGCLLRLSFWVASLLSFSVWEFQLNYDPNCTKAFRWCGSLVAPFTQHIISPNG